MFFCYIGGKGGFTILQPIALWMTQFFFVILMQIIMSAGDNI